LPEVATENVKHINRSLTRWPGSATVSMHFSHATQPCRNVSLQWLVPQFGMASLCRSAHSLESFLRHLSLHLRWFYLVVPGLGGPPIIPLWRGVI